MVRISFLKNIVRVPVVNQQVSWQKHDFVYCFRPIYIVSRVFGLLPFSLTFHSNGEVQKPNVSKLDIVWFGISLSFLLNAISMSIAIQKSSGKKGSLISILGDMWMLFAGLINGVLTIVLDMYNRHKFVDIIKKINTFDREVRQ